MILVVEGERASYADLVDRLDPAGVELATSVREARDRLDATMPDAVLLTLPVADAAPLLEEVRAGRYDRPGLPIVALADGDAALAEAIGVDETVEVPVSDSTIEAAVERAALLGRYKDAVNEFFDACRERAEGEAVGDRPREARRTADACLEEIQEREDTVAVEALFQGI